MALVVDACFCCLLFCYMHASDGPVGKKWYAIPPVLTQSPIPSNQQEPPTPAHKPEISSPVDPDSLPSTASFSVPEENPAVAPGPSSANLALLRLLQSAFNRQMPAVPPHVLAAPPKTFQRERIPPQKLYQALDQLNRFRGSENGLFSDYSDNFYRAQPYRHRDDRLLQALFDMLGDDQQ